MDRLNETTTLFGDVIKGKARARRTNPRLNAFLEKVEGFLENYSRPENNGSGSESDDLAAVRTSRTIKTDPEAEAQHSETTADLLEWFPKRELKQESELLPNLESESQLGPGSRSNPESVLKSPVQEPWGSVEGKVFGIDWILELILGYLDDDSITLLNCRFVNKHRNKISTGILNACQIVRVDITDEENGFQIKRGGHLLPLPLGHDSLTEAFESACHSGGPFPWNYFSIQEGSLTNPHLQSFLSKHGRIIKQLNIELSQRYEDPPDPDPLITDLRRLLAEQVPNIEVLTLSEFPGEWEELRLFPERKEELVDVLSNLKKIHFASAPPKFVAMDLLRVSQRLQIIDWNRNYYTRHTPYWEMILNSNRVELLTRLQMKLPLTRTDSGVLSKLIEKQPLLSYLEIGIYFSEGKKDYTQEGFAIISKLLQSSSSTLKTLVVPQFILRRISPIPRLPKLKRLVLDKTGSTSSPVGGNFSVAKYFPQMTDLAIVLDDRQEHNYGKDFFQDLTKRSLKSVRTLELHLLRLNFPQLLTSLELKHKFPKLTNLTLRNITDFANKAKVLWTLARLQTLEININLLNGSENEFPAIDAGFTGFSKETCVQLYESSDDVEISTLMELRESKSLLDMECLETLTLVLTGFNGWPDRPHPEYKRILRIISHLSGLFAFRMCPKLKVKLRVYVGSEHEKKLENLLSPIFPYVHRTDFKGPRTMSRFLNIL